jgi:hypothetical protein
MPCQCAKCLVCKGSGVVWFAVGGRYLGPNRCDDLDEMDGCDECQGSGITETCDSCRADYEEQMDREVDW